MSPWVQVRYVRRSLCPCGFSLLTDEVPLGTIYEIKPGDGAPGKLRCGGCGAVLDVMLVPVSREGVEWEGKWIPNGVFGVVGDQTE